MEDIALKLRRSKILIALVVAVISFTAAGFVLHARIARNRSLAYESLQKGMSIEQVSALLHRDVRREMTAGGDISGIEIHDWDGLEWSIIPQAEIQLIFTDGRLAVKSRREVTLAECWQGLMYQVKKLIGR
jgi:hypothetical protein